MAEGKTSMFGKTYNTIGSTDSNFIIKTKGDLKVLWGNKYIDVIKNGKIASEGSQVLFVVNSVDEIKQNGVYIVASEEKNDLWVNIDGIKILISNTSEETTYVSFLVKQTPNYEQKHLALTNIGFYYETLSQAKLADIQSGIIYVENDNKLYIAKDGILTEYQIGAYNKGVETEEQSAVQRHPLYIDGYSLWESGLEYIKCSGEMIHIYKQTVLYNMLQSESANEEYGYRLYIDDSKSILEIDLINLRIYPYPITHAKLLTMIELKQLNPKMFYMLTDFLNPWEVTWDNELTYYEDLYTLIGEVEHLSGLRNMMKLVILAKNESELIELVWSPLNPDWTIHYDALYRGPEHKFVIDDKEVIYYGFRSREDEEGNVSYLPCKGKITYLKDEFGNEGNFNFRQFMFKYKNDKWRYCIDNTEDGKMLGSFGEGKGNSFYLDHIDTYTLVFEFERLTDSEEVLIGFKLHYKEDNNVFMELGHKIRLQSINPINENHFKLSTFHSEEDPTIFDFKSDNLCGNTIINVDNNITVNATSFINNTFSNIYYEYSKIDILFDMIGNVLTNISGDIKINGKMTNNSISNLLSGLKIDIECEGNKIGKFLEESDLIIKGLKFDNNIIELLLYNINNTGIFTNNTITECLGTISNLGTIHNNSIKNFKDYYLSNSANKIILNNSIDLIESDFTNTGTIEDNTINIITYDFSNNKLIKNNTINVINDFSNTLTLENNIIDTIYLVYGGRGSLLNNKISLLQDVTINEAVNNNIFGEIISTTINKPMNNNTINYCKESTFSGDCVYNYIETFNNVYILNTFSNNKIKDFVKNTTFAKKADENIIIDQVEDCELDEFNNNRIYSDFIKVYASGLIEKSTFNDTINKLNCCKLINCEFDEISDLDLDEDVYYSTFHGLIGKPLRRQFSEEDWELLSNNTKKKDVYPNVKVVCIPEIYIPGMIIMWHGNTDTIPEGWYLCDGQNNTPNLLGKFIKAGEEEGDNEVDEKLDKSDNTITLDITHLPFHTHAHDEHIHKFDFEYSGNTENSDVLSMSSTSNYLTGIDYNTDSFVYNVEGEGVSDVSTKDAIITIRPDDDPVQSEGGSHNHEINISLSNIETEPSTSLELQEEEWENLPIKIEPVAYSLIFIMRGYDN